MSYIETEPMSEPFFSVNEDPQTGALVVSIKLDRATFEQLSTRLIIDELQTIVSRSVDVLRDKLVERVQAEVLSSVDVPSMINMATLRAGVALGERLAKYAVQPTGTMSVRGF